MANEAAEAARGTGKTLPKTFILLTLLLDAMGIGLIIPVMPDLIQEVRGGSIANAALWGAVLSTSFALMQFIFAPIVGGLSDQYGRRPVLLVSLVFMALDYVVMALAGSIWLLLLGRVVGGITAATQSTANAYMADISAPEDKVKNFGLIGAAFGLGFVLGPLVGGLLGEFGTRAPFYAAAGFAAINALLGWYVLEETVTDAIRRPFSLRRSNPLGTLRVLKAIPSVGKLLLVYFLYQLAFMVYPAIWSYWSKERLGWDPLTIGLSLALFGITMAIVQGGLIRLFLRWLGERGTVVYAKIFDIGVFLILGVISSGTWTLILTPIAALAAVIAPALQGLMSQAVADDQQGELQGALTSASAVASIFGAAAYPLVFAGFVSSPILPYQPGAPFFLSALLIGIALFFFLREDRK